jgi:hypothetical protein
LVIDTVGGDDDAEDVLYVWGVDSTHTSNPCKTLSDAQDDGDCDDADVVFSGNKATGDQVDAGDFLTTTVACSTGFSQIYVNDNRYFSAGIADGTSGSPGPAYVAGDLVKIEGISTIYEVTGITTVVYPALTVTPAPSTCASGKGVSLVWSGDKPDIGATRGQ